MNWLSGAFCSPIIVGVARVLEKGGNVWFGLDLVYCPFTPKEYVDYK
jgi:hypothetical protein